MGLRPGDGSMIDIKFPIFLPRALAMVTGAVAFARSPSGPAANWTISVLASPQHPQNKNKYS